MTKDEKRREILEISEHIGYCLDRLAVDKNRLEEIGCKHEARLMDTITGKLYNLMYKVAEKR